MPSSCVSSFQFLNGIENAVMKDIDTDPALAIGRFELRRILDLKNDHARSELCFTQDGKKESEKLISLQIICTAKCEEHYAFEINIAADSIQKKQELKLIIHDQDRMRRAAKKFALYVKSYVVEALEGRLSTDAQPRVPQKTDNIFEEETEQQQTRRKTIQMSPQELQKALLEEAAKESSAPPQEAKSKVDKLIADAANTKNGKPLEMSAEDLQNALFGGDPAPVAEPAPKVEAAKPSTGSNAPLEMSADEVQKLLAGDAGTTPAAPQTTTTTAETTVPSTEAVASPSAATAPQPEVTPTVTEAAPTEGTPPTEAAATPAPTEPNVASEPTLTEAPPPPSAPVENAPTPQQPTDATPPASDATPAAPQA